MQTSAYGITGKSPHTEGQRVELIVGSMLDAVGKFHFGQCGTLLIAKQG